MAHRRLPFGGPPASSQLFGIAAEQRAGTLLLTLTGEFDLATIGQVEAALERGLEQSPAHVVFDLRDVRFLDLAALMTVIRADERSRQDASFDVQVVAPRGLASRVFTLTRAGEQLSMLEAPAQPRATDLL